MERAAKVGDPGRPNLSPGTMTRGRAQISALLLGFLLAALPASVVAGTPPPEACLIPLESGTRWVYEAEVRWTPVAGEKGTQRPGIQSARLRWTNEVLFCVTGRTARAAVLHRFPTEVLGMDPEVPRNHSVLVETANQIIQVPARNLSHARQLAKRLANQPMTRLRGRTVLLEKPLRVNQRWGFDDSDEGPQIRTREDGWYCWHVEAVRAHRLSLKSGPPNRDVTSYVIAYRTNPDHQLLELTPGIGFTQLEYEHHGTVGEEKVRLIDFIPGSRNESKPRAASSRNSSKVAGTSIQPPRDKSDARCRWCPRSTDGRPQPAVGRPGASTRGRVPR